MKEEAVEGHGNHWEAVLGDVDGIASLLPAVLVKGRLIGRHDLPSRPGGDQVPGQAAAIVWPETGPVQFLVLCILREENGEKRSHVCSFYPIFADGPVTRLTIDRILEWQNGIEGQIFASTSTGAVLGFFDPMYWRNRERYRVGEAYDFHLAALASRLRKPSEEFFRVTEGPMLDVEREDLRAKGKTQEAEALDHVDVHLTGAVLAIPSEHAPDDYGGRVPSVSRDTFTVEENKVLRYRCVFSRPLSGEDGDDVQIDLYAFPHAVSGRPPAGGKDIEGAFWLQGWLAEE